MQKSVPLHEIPILNCCWAIFLGLLDTRLHFCTSHASAWDLLSQGGKASSLGSKRWPWKLTAATNMCVHLHLGFLKSPLPSAFFPSLLPSPPQAPQFYREHQCHTGSAVLNTHAPCRGAVVLLMAPRRGTTGLQTHRTPQRDKCLSRNNTTSTSSISSTRTR